MADPSLQSHLSSCVWELQGSYLPCDLRQALCHLQASVSFLQNTRFVLKGCFLSAAVHINHRGTLLKCPVVALGRGVVHVTAFLTSTTILVHLVFSSISTHSRLNRLSQRTFLCIPHHPGQQGA